MIPLLHPDVCDEADGCLYFMKLLLGPITMTVIKYCIIWKYISNERKKILFILVGLLRGSYAYAVSIANEVFLTLKDHVSPA